MDEHMAKNLSRMTREADMEKLRIQQQQTLGKLDTKIDAMMERRTQATMDRLDGLLGSRSGSKKGEPNSGEHSREPRVNFNEQPNRRRTYGSTRERGSSSSYATGDNGSRVPNIRGSSAGNRPTSNERPTQDTHSTGRCDSRNWSHANQGRSHSVRRGNPEPISGGNDAQEGHSRDATSLATAFEPLNRSLEKFLTRLSRTTERSEKSRRVFEKPRATKTNLMAVLIPG